MAFDNWLSVTANASARIRRAITSFKGRTKARRMVRVGPQSVRAFSPFRNRREPAPCDATGTSAASFEICRRQLIPGCVWKWMAAESCVAPVDRLLLLRIRAPILFLRSASDRAAGYNCEQREVPKTWGMPQDATRYVRAKTNPTASCSWVLLESLRWSTANPATTRTSAAPDPVMAVTAPLGGLASHIASSLSKRSAKWLWWTVPSAATDFPTKLLRVRNVALR